MAVYPTGTKVFTTKHNLTDTVYAADVNDIQDEVVAMQTALGVVPARASSILAAGGKQVTKDYGTVASRLQSIQMGDDLPVAHLTVSTVKIKISTETFISFKKVRDPYGLFNGADLTIPVSSWVIVSGDCFWHLNDNGYRMMLLKDGTDTELTSDQRPAKAWSLRGTRNTLTWQGYVKANTRLRLKLHQNSDVVLGASSVDFKVAIVRRYPDNLF